MSELYSSKDYARMHHFISDGAWDARELMDRVATDVNTYLGVGVRKSLILDECGIPKKGDMSVGVARQYCGALGKTDNCQMGVFGYLCSGRFGSLVDARLYLPDSWTQDPERCDDAGIPEEHQLFKTKIELAMEIVCHQRALGIEFDYINADSFYGHDSDFRDSLEDKGEVYMVDVRSAQRVYLKEPKLFLPERENSSGRAPTRIKCGSTPVKVDTLAGKAPSKNWKKVKIRLGTKGNLYASFYVRRVWTWDGKSAQPREVMLVIRRDKMTKGYEYKFSLCNGDPASHTLQDYAEMQAQRYWIEKGFKECKKEIGMDEYQARGWVAWQHIMAMTMMALGFMLKEKLANQKKIPLLSTNDIRDLLIHKYSGGSKTFDDMVETIKLRHERRRADILLRKRKSEIMC
jgi:SRSO17 transposase